MSHHLPPKPNACRALICSASAKPSGSNIAGDWHSIKMCGKGLLRLTCTTEVEGDRHFVSDRGLRNVINAAAAFAPEFYWLLRGMNETNRDPTTSQGRSFLARIPAT